MTLLKKPPSMITPVEVQLMHKVVVEKREVDVQAAVKEQSQKKACKVQRVVMIPLTTTYMAKATSLARIDLSGCDASQKFRGNTLEIGVMGKVIASGMTFAAKHLLNSATC